MTIVYGIKHNIIYIKHTEAYNHPTLLFQFCLLMELYLIKRINDNISLYIFAKLIFNLNAMKDCGTNKQQNDFKDIKIGGAAVGARLYNREAVSSSCPP